MNLAKLALAAAAVLAPLSISSAASADHRAPQAQRYTRGDVYINGIKLNEQQKRLMADIIQEAFMPAGHWYITQEGMMGLAGQPPVGSIVPYVQAYLKRTQGGGGRRGGGTHLSNSQNGYGGVQNGCAWVSIPNGPSMMSC
jgi:hypothetical protein